MAEKTTGLTPFIQKPDPSALTDAEFYRSAREDVQDDPPGIAGAAQNMQLVKESHSNPQAGAGVHSSAIERMVAEGKLEGPPPVVVEDSAEVSLPKEDVVSENLPPLFSFGDKKLFQEKIKEKGIDGVTRDVVGIVKQLLPDLTFTYEDLRDGSADVLDLIHGPAGDLHTSSRAMTDEAILAMFTDLEDFGKYDPPVRVRNADGTLAVDEEGQPVYEDKNYNLSAIAGGARDISVTAGFTLLGMWQGSRLGAAAYMARAPRTGLRPLDVGGKLGAAAMGAVVGAGVLVPVAAYVEEWLFDEPDPIVVPSLQAAYNSGETAAPWVGTRLAAKPLGEVFNYAKVLADFKTIASSKFAPEELIKLFGKEITATALAAAGKQAGKGTVRRVLTPNSEGGPIAARIADTIMRGGQNALKEGANNPKTFLGIEALVAGSAAYAAYQAEKIFPGSAWGRFGFELMSAPAALLVVKPLVGGFQSTINLVKSILSGEISEKGRGALAASVDKEAGRRLTAEISSSPEALTSTNPEQELDALVEALMLAANKGQGAKPLPSTVASEAGAALAPPLARIQGQVATHEKDLAAATEEGREHAVANAKAAIMQLRQTKTPEGLQLAASIEQRVVEQEAIDVIEKANVRLIAAAEKVFGNRERIPQDAALGERFYNLQLQLVAALKQKSRTLWRGVPDFEVRQFTTAEGIEVRQPNSLTIFEVPTSNGGLQFSSAGLQRRLCCHGCLL